jgi:hypothetical protein
MTPKAAQSQSSGGAVRITDGQYAGQRATVVRMLPDHGANGFAEVELPDLKRKGGRESVRDLVPLPYLADI